MGIFKNNFLAESIQNQLRIVYGLQSVYIPEKNAFIIYRTGDTQNTDFKHAVKAAEHFIRGRMTDIKHIIPIE